MKRLFVTVLLVLAMPCLAFGQVLTPQPPKPGPEHQKLGIWVGNWTYEGETKATPLGPAGKVTGKNTTRPILGDFFVEFRGEEKGPGGAFEWVEIDGYDPVAKLFTWNGFQSDGSVYVVTYTLDGTTMTYSGTLQAGGKLVKIRGTCVFAADFNSNVQKTEVSVDGKALLPSFEGKASKVK